MTFVSLAPMTGANSTRGRIVRSVSRSHLGFVRPINEDRVFDHAEAGVWAVVDGMGGHRGGDLAAQQVVDTLRQAVGEATGLAADRLVAALLIANAAICRHNLQFTRNAGATAVAATLAGDRLDIAWAGDSRAYRLHHRRAERLTRDHSIVQQLVDAGLLTPAMAERHPQANVVTRALGADPAVTLETVSVAAAGSRFLLCSDGLSRSLLDDDIDADLPIDALASRLVENALKRDGTDNLSLVLIDVA